MKRGLSESTATEVFSVDYNDWFYIIIILSLLCYERVRLKGACWVRIAAIYLSVITEAKIPMLLCIELISVAASYGPTRVTY